ELSPAIVAGPRGGGDEVSPPGQGPLPPPAPPPPPPPGAPPPRAQEPRPGGAPYARAQNLRPWLRAAYDRTLDDIDVLLMPTTPFRAFRLDDELRTSERVLRGWAD